MAAVEDVEDHGRVDRLGPAEELLGRVQGGGHVLDLAALAQELAQLGVELGPLEVQDVVPRLELGGAVEALLGGLEAGLVVPLEGKLEVGVGGLE